MSRWPAAKLGDVITFRGGGTPRKDNPEYWGDDIPWATVKDFNNGTELSGTKDSISIKGLECSASNLIPAGNVIIPTRMALGKAAINTVDMAINQDLRALLPKKNIDSRYLLHAMIGLSDQIKANASGATVKGINQEKLKKFEIPLPTAKEQRRIAKILDAADALRGKRRESLVQLDALIQSVFLNLFGDPVTNPRSWPNRSLGSICDVGSSKRVFVNDLVERGIPFYRGTEIGKLAEGKDVSPSLFITKDQYDRFKKQSGVPKKGDLLLPSICPDGRIYKVANENPFYFKDARVLWIKTSDASIDSTFLKYYLKQSFLTNYSKIASGTTFSELKIFSLKKLLIQVPPTNIQQHFANIVKSIEQNRTRLRAYSNELDTLFLSLQSRAFNGDL